MRNNFPEIAKGAQVLALYENAVVRYIISLYHGSYVVSIWNKRTRIPRCKCFDSIYEARYEFRKIVSYMES